MEQPIQNSNTPQTEGKDVKFEKFRYVVDLIKWFIVSVALVIMTTIIDSGFRDRAAGLQEIQQYDKYVTDLIVLNKEIGPRRLLAQYFATVTASDKLRNHWKEYYEVLNSEYLEYKRQDSTIKAALYDLAVRIADSSKNVSLNNGKLHEDTLHGGKNDIAEKRKNLKFQRLQEEANNLNRELNSNIKLPENSKITLVRISIAFHTQDDDKDWNTEISISLNDANGKIVSKTNLPTVIFPSHSDRTFQLNIGDASVNKNDILNGTLIISIKPSGNDTWKFTPSLLAVFSDGSVINYNNFTLLRLDHSINTIQLKF